MRIPARRPPWARPTRLAAAAAAAAAVLAAATLSAAGAASSSAAAGPAAPSYVFVHDPSMARQAGTYYLFSTGDPAGQIGNGNIQLRTSRDLRTWTFRGTVFAQQPAWITAALGKIPNLWAPDISYFGGQWHLYYAGSSFGSSNSVIGLATTPTLDPASPRYHWTDQGQVFRSASGDDFNAIDPSLVSTPSGEKWLVFGSFWSGIMLIRLDPATGKPAGTPTVYPLAQQPAPDPLEGAGITFHGGYYYLFASLGFCCRGLTSTYRIIAGRSRAVTGPYLDPAGTPMMNAGGMEVQGTGEGMIGPGSESVFTDAGRSYLVYHYYDAFHSGDPWVQVRPLMWTASGWPVTGAPLVPVPGAAP